SFYDDVLSKTTPGPYYTLSMLGRAETLAALERYGESAETYHEVLRQVTNQPYDNQVDLQVVRQSTTQLYEQLRASRNYKESMAYLRIASPLAPAGDARLQAIYTERLADLAYALGEQVLARSRRQVGDDGLAEAKAAREAFIESAEAYLRLAKLTMTNEGASSAAAWRAAEALDLAGEYERRTEVLEAFIRERPGDVRVPEALLRLGQTYQAMGARDRAIGAYQRNLIDYPRTYWAVRCLVPLAECFIDSRQMDKAEQTLLRIVDREPTEAVALIRPEAQEYRDALFRLGDLYLQSGQYEKAIGRFEEALQRYPEDKRSDRVAFLMADAYRRSAAQIRTDLEDPQKVAFKDELTVQHQERLKRAEELFARVIERYRNRPADLLSDLDTTCLKMSHFYRADSIYDRSRLTDPSDIEPLVQSLRRYDEAAWLYQSDPIAMSAFVQIINCHLRMGNIVEARRALQRAGWALRNIPEDRFDASVPGGSKDFWEKYLSWLGRAPMLAAKTEG
ncbi:MAG TPA: tetratricopeptide repeat protein, partial [Phycisphaerae bacterium]|nr:tetratricopeptide repeat protein [Phycisphaerae bacterium]